MTSKKIILFLMLATTFVAHGTWESANALAAQPMASFVDAGIFLSVTGLSATFFCQLNNSTNTNASPFRENILEGLALSVSTYLGVIFCKWTEIPALYACAAPLAIHLIGIIDRNGCAAVYPGIVFGLAALALKNQGVYYAHEYGIVNYIPSPSFKLSSFFTK